MRLEVTLDLSKLLIYSSIKFPAKSTHRYSKLLLASRRKSTDLKSENGVDFQTVKALGQLTRPCEASVSSFVKEKLMNIKDPALSLAN